MKTLYIGVDPGQNGGICELWPDGKMDAWPMGDDDERADYFRSILVRSVIDGFAISAWLEQVGGYIGKPQPGSAMFSFGNGYGFLRGCLRSNCIPTRLVVPRTWQAGLGLDGIKGPARKAALKNIATERFPSLKPTLKTADAILIAEYGRNQT